MVEECRVWARQVRRIAGEVAGARHFYRSAFATGIDLPAIRTGVERMDELIGAQTGRVGDTIRE
jgi:hypothetical protein